MRLAERWRNQPDGLEMRRGLIRSPGNRTVALSSTPWATGAIGPNSTGPRRAGDRPGGVIRLHERRQAYARRRRRCGRV